MGARFRLGSPSEIESELNFKGFSGRRPETTNPPPIQPGHSPSGQVRSQIGCEIGGRGVRSQAEAYGGDDGGAAAWVST